MAFVPPQDIQYHVARIVLLLDRFATGRSALDGMTKLAKLDFLLRYPAFLERLLLRDGLDWPSGTQPTAAERLAVESRMIRYKYGPWDDRYYPIVGQLVGTGLADLVPGRGRVSLRPTAAGRAVASRLRQSSEWQLVAQRCALLKRHYNVSGDALKSRIYRELPEAVDLPIGTEIS